MSRVELRRLAQIFIWEVKVRKNGNLVVRGDGFKKLMGKEKAMQIQRLDDGDFLIHIDIAAEKLVSRAEPRARG